MKFFAFYNLFILIFPVIHFFFYKLPNWCANVFFVLVFAPYILISVKGLTEHLIKKEERTCKTDKLIDELLKKAKEPK